MTGQLSQEQEAQQKQQKNNNSITTAEVQEHLQLKLTWRWIEEIWADDDNLMAMGLGWS